MNESQYMPLIVGLIGVVVGSITSIAAIFIQQRAQNKRERSNQIFYAATEQFKLAIDVAKLNKRGGVFPFAVFLHHQNQLFELIEKNNLNAESLKKLLNDNEKVERLYSDII